MAVGVVCEFNPFHNGHKYLLDSIKKQTDEPIVCAMSGFFVQRGEPACCPKQVRADWAIKAGADLVLENPYPFCCASAEHFAKGAISVLCDSGLCSEIAFGTELGTQDDFLLLAEALLDKKTEDGIRQILKSKKSLGFAVARELYIKEKYGQISQLLSSPNSLLGVEYAKAILSSGKKINIIPIKRHGGGHDAAPYKNLASAGFLRDNPTAENFEIYCPEYVSRYFTDQTTMKMDPEKYYAALSSRILFSDSKMLAECAEVPWDYAEKLRLAVQKCKTYDEFFEQIKSKHMTNAHLQRMLIYILTDVPAEMLKRRPQSTNLLAFSDDGAKLLRKLKKDCEDFTVLSKISDIKKLSEDEKQRAEKALLAENIYERLLV